MQRAPSGGGDPRLDFPRWAHRPGITPQPDEAPLEAVKAGIPARYAEGVPADDPALLYGLALYEGGFFWEAHEIWEAVWKAAPMNGADRLALRALIQTANAGLKLHLGRRRAAERLFREVLELLAELRSRPGRTGIALGVDCQGLSRIVAELVADLGADPPGPVRHPRLASFVSR